MDLTIMGRDYKVFLVVFIILLGCKTEQKQNKEEQDSIPFTIIKKKQDSLFIEGDNIWVRDNPRNGKVVIKLNKGDRCVIIDTSKVDTIRGCIDYWYQIKYKNTIGWVFGSQTNIKSENSKETQLFLKQNHEKLKCNNIDYSLINYKEEDYDYLSQIILFAGNINLDTLDFREKRVLFERKKYAQIIMEDYNFDGLCDFILTDVMTASHGAMNNYYFLYDIETKGFKEDTSLPKRNGGIKINTDKREVIIYCSYHDCEGSYKFIDRKFIRVSGKFTLEL